MNAYWQTRFFQLGIIGTFQFLIFIHIAMWLYAGGTLHEPNNEGYSFTLNFFSDLGRTYTFVGASNLLSSLIFRITMAITGVCVALFFVALPTLFYSRFAKSLSIIAAIFGVLAGLCYIAIGNIPYNVDYWGHQYFVRRGFVLFLLMVFFFTWAIIVEENYPNRYAYALGLFALILGIQISIMLFGPRSWTSERALFLQAFAQKTVVYAEVLCMLYQAYGALQVHRKIHTIKL